jgi:hypothetical protein
MKENKTLIWAIIIGGILLRLVPHVPNFAPITATALFAGVYLNKRWAIAIPLLAMVVSDYLLLYIHPFSAQWISFDQIYSPLQLAHSTTIYVWGSFVLSAAIGWWLKRHQGVGNTAAAAIFASIQFFIITNFGVWAAGMYAPNLGGLAQSYTMALPFFRWTLLGDLFYTAAFFGLYALATRGMNKVVATNQ